MPAQSGKPKLGTTRGLVETILPWFREIWSKYFLQQKRPASVLTTERRAESVAEQRCHERVTQITSQRRKALRRFHPHE
jgi:hypothetical protein